MKPPVSGFRDSYVIILFVLYGIFWIALAFNPHEWSTWALENIVLGLAVIALLNSYHRFRLSRVSYTFIVLLMSLLTVGSHYTYSLTPYDTAF